MTVGLAISIGGVQVTSALITQASKILQSKNGIAVKLAARNPAGGVQHESTATCPDPDGLECTLQDGDLR